MQPSRSSARYFLKGFVDKPFQKENDQASIGAEDDEPSQFKTPEDYLNGGPSPAKIEEVKDYLIETSQTKNRVSTPYA